MQELSLAGFSGALQLPAAMLERCHLLTRQVLPGRAAVSYVDHSLFLSQAPFPQS